MSFLNVAAVVTQAQSKIVDASTELRAKLVSWFDEVASDVLNQPREWVFLNTTVTLPVTNNQAQLPAGASEIVAIEIGDILLTRDNLLNIFEAHAYNNVCSISPVGYTLSPSGLITFLPLAGLTTSYIVMTYDGPITYDGDPLPGAPTSCNLLYEAGRDPTFSDVGTATIFPVEFKNVFISGLRMHYYDYMKDGRFSKELATYDFYMRQAKAWDNRNKPTPPFNQHGFVRDRP